MKKVLITGATGAIGEAITQKFYENGYALYLAYNSNKEKAQGLCEKYENCTLIQFDMGKKEEIKEALKDIEVDVLINNAGITRDSHIYWMDDDGWEDVVNTNLNGTYQVTKAVLPFMIGQKSGSIVNLTSISGIVGNSGQANYATTKGGIIAFTKTLCLDLSRFNIRVNAVAPGLIESEMTKDISIETYKKIIPQRRFGRAQEVAEVVFFLAHSATYVNGEVINVSGGMVR